MGDENVYDGFTLTFLNWFIKSITAVAITVSLLTVLDSDSVIVALLTILLAMQVPFDSNV